MATLSPYFHLLFSSFAVRFFSRLDPDSRSEGATTKKSTNLMTVAHIQPKYSPIWFRSPYRMFISISRQWGTTLYSYQIHSRDLEIDDVNDMEGTLGSKARGNNNSSLEILLLDSEASGNQLARLCELTVSKDSSFQKLWSLVL